MSFRENFKRRWGQYPHEFDREQSEALASGGIGANRHSVRRTTSSRRPGRVNIGVVYARPPVRLPKLDTCPCGTEKTRCDECGASYCAAPGHAAHVCAGVADAP